MKNVFTNLMILLSAAVLSVACQDNLGDDKNGGSGKYVDYSDGRLQLILQDSRTVEADADGVSISIKNLTVDNVTFECRPGANVASYRCDVIPLSMLYNTLINEKMVDAPREDVEDIIFRLISNSSSTNGVVFSEASLDNFYSHTFDWMNTEYHNGNILSDMDYVICVVPYFDEAGLESSNVNLCWFKTPEIPLVGNPDLNLNLSVSYRDFKVVHEPNDDCKYIVYWSYTTDQIDEYTDIVGETMLRDFVRCASAVYDVADVSNRAYSVSFGSEADSKISQTAIAVALDINGSPAEWVKRRDFNLKTIPDSPAAEYTIVPYKSAASIFWIKINFEPTCRYCCYRWLTEEQADVIKAYTPEQQKAYARSLISAQGGWGVDNPEFRFDATANVPTGFAAEVIDNQIVAYQPASKYVIVSAGANYYDEVTELQFSDPIEMKTRVTDRPEDCAVPSDTYRLVLDNASRTGFRYTAEYDNPQDIAMFYFQVVAPVAAEDREKYPDQCPPADLYNASRQEWMKYFFETYREADDGERMLDVNTWDTDISDELDTRTTKRLTHFGYEPGTEYVVAYCIEDMNGVIGEVRFVTISTAAIAAGDNPQAEISAALKDGRWTFTFNANEDTGTMLYMTSSYGDDNYDILGLPFILNDPYDDYTTYDSIFNLWDDKIMDLGLSTKSLTTYSTEEARSDDTIILALCLPIGQDANGKAVYGQLQHLLIVNGQLKHLDDYRQK